MNGWWKRIRVREMKRNQVEKGKNENRDNRENNKENKENKENLGE